MYSSSSSSPSSLFLTSLNLWNESLSTTTATSTTTNSIITSITLSPSSMQSPSSSITSIPSLPIITPSFIESIQSTLYRLNITRTTLDELNISYTNKYHDEMICYDCCPTLKMPITNLISMILYAIVFIIGLFGNTLVIYVVMRFSKMQTVTNMYILNLAIADECYLICIPFLITTIHVEKWMFGKTFCNIYLISASITQFTSSIFLFILSADRYIAVCHPISSPRYRSPIISKFVTLIAWTISALMMLPVMLYANTIKNYHTNKISCGIVWPQNNGGGSGRTFLLYTFILGFAIPLCLILIFYFLVIKRLKTVGPKTKSKEKKRSHRKVTKLVLTVITVYILCWLPYWISQVALVISTQVECLTHLERTIFVLAGCLGYSNSAMNPILYAFLSDNFKKSFLKAFTCRAGKDFNTQLQMENSYFRGFGKRNSDAKQSTSLKMIAANKQQQPLQNRQQHFDADIFESVAIVYDTVGGTDSAAPSTSQNKTNSINGNGNSSLIDDVTTVANNNSNNNKNNNLIENFTEKPPILHTDF